jgi:hypothetical protein
VFAVDQFFIGVNILSSAGCTESMAREVTEQRWSQARSLTITSALSVFNIAGGEGLNEGAGGISARTMVIIGQGLTPSHRRCFSETPLGFPSSPLRRWPRRLPSSRAPSCFVFDRWRSDRGSRPRSIRWISTDVWTDAGPNA